MNGGAARQAGSSRPQRVVGHGQQQFVAVIQQGVGRHRDQLACAVTQINIIQRHAGNTLLLRFVHHGFAGRKNAFAV